MQYSIGMHTEGGPEGILERMHDLELAGPVSFLRSNLIDGVKHIPIAFSGTSG